MEKEIKVIFEGQDEIISTIDSESEIVKLLGLPSEKCALINTKIKLTKKLGEGVNGQAFQIEFPGMGDKLYVAKKTQLTLQVFNGDRGKADKFLDKENLTWDTIRDWQPKKNVTIFENANYYDKISIVIPPKMCLVKEVKRFPSIPTNYGYTHGSHMNYSDNGLTFTVPKGSYVCENNTFSELVIAVYAGKLYRDAVCINFFNTYSMFTCVNAKQYARDFNEYTQFTFMDKIDRDLWKIRGCVTMDKYIEENKRISPNITNGIYVQTLFAIAAYQQQYKISHNDLHLENVFVEFVTDKTMFNGEKVKDADYYHYSIGGNDIYIPAIPVIVKIGDFGLSTKYSKPIIGSLEVFEDGMDTEDGTGSWIPNVYVPQYDSLYFTTRYIHGVVKDNKFLNTTDLIYDCITFMCPDMFDPIKRILNRVAEVSIIKELTDKGYIKPSNIRPVLTKLIDVKNARQTLLGPVIQHYYTWPNSGKIITLGKII